MVQNGVVEDPANSDEHAAPNTGTTTPRDELDSRSNADLTSTINPGLYGWGKLTPRWLQTFNKPEWLLACFCFSVFSSTLAGALMPAITDTLERRFHLNSVRSGLMNSSYDIASLIIVLFVCHYGERGHKGKWIGIGSIVFGLGSCIMTLPHYVADPSNPGAPADDNYISNATCPSEYPQDICHAEVAGTGIISRSYYIFLAGQAVRGIGGTCLGTLMLSYIDENVSQRTSPFYLSIISVIGLIAMALGFLTGGELLHLYEDFDRVPRDQWPAPTDPKWYGCWWLGYYIGGISAFMISLPLLGFPKELPNKIKARQQDREQAHNEDHVSGTGFGQSWSEIPKMTLTLLKNPVFSCFTLRNTLEVMFASGWGVFMPKYLQNMYGMEPGFSAMIAGGISLGPVMIGTLFGGWIIKKFNWKVRGVLFFGLVTTAVGSFCCLGTLFSCHTRSIAGANVDYAGNTVPKDAGILFDSCNANCSCDTTNYDPVCFREAGVTYFSPCFAGCSQSIRDGDIAMYTHCECLKLHFPTVSVNNSVIAGACQEGAYCTNQRNWFIVFWVFTCLFYGMSGMPLLQSFLRAVPYQQRTLALGLQSIPMRMLGTVPGPILMGFLFDYSCILWKTQCEDKLSCLQYNNETIVSLLVYLGVVFRVTSGALLAIAIVFYRPPKTKTPSATYGGAVTAAKDAATLAEELEQNSIVDMVLTRLRRCIRRGKAQ